MNISLRIASLVVVSFAAASAFSTDAPSMQRTMQNSGITAHAARPSDGALAMVAVKCTNPRECSVGGA